jgi:hypothetical protein
MRTAFPIVSTVILSREPDVVAPFTATSEIRFPFTTRTSLREPVVPEARVTKA